MVKYPYTVKAAEVTPELREIIAELMRRLFAGPDRVHEVLQEQLGRAELSEVTLTGAGFFADFVVPDDAPLAEPLEMIGGCVEIVLKGTLAGAGSLVKVSGGRLDFLEVYINGDEPWPERPEVVAFGVSMPISPPSGMPQPSSSDAS